MFFTLRQQGISTSSMHLLKDEDLSLSKKSVTLFVK
jgi:hypothetical protein